MLKFTLAAAIAAFAFVGPANAAETVACDDASVTMVMGLVEAAPAEKKEMAMAELTMAKEKMAAGMADECSKHLGMAKEASMKQ